MKVTAFFSPVLAVAKYVWSKVPSVSQETMRSVLCVALMCGGMLAFGETTSGNEALSEGITQFGDAVDTMKQFVPIIKNLCYILAVVFGLVGGVMIVIAMNNHEQDVNKKIAMTVGAVVFMLVIAQAIPLIFGVAVD